MDSSIFRGDLYYADLSPVIGCEQGGVRPVLVIQNELGNRHSPTVIVTTVTTHFAKNTLPTHVFIKGGTCLPRNSVIKLEQIKTIDRARLLSYIGHLDATTMETVNRALAVSVGLLEPAPVLDRESAIKRQIPAMMGFGFGR